VVSGHYAALDGDAGTGRPILAAPPRGPATADEHAPRAHRLLRRLPYWMGSVTQWRRQPMDTPATYFQLGFILISVPNLLVIMGMVVLFIAALVAPFPGHGGIDQDGDEQPE